MLLIVERGRLKFVLLILLLFITTCAHVPLRGLKKSEVRGPSLIPLAVHYLTDERDIRTKLAWWLEQSNKTLTPHGIGLVVWSEDHLYLLPDRVSTLHDRQRLGAFVKKDGMLHVFVVDFVSVDPGDGLNGLHTLAAEHGFVILATRARDTTLAHEVGHALGLNHVSEEDNVMCTERDDEGARFTYRQGGRMRRTARALVMRDWR